MALKLEQINRPCVSLAAVLQVLVLWNDRHCAGTFYFFPVIIGSIAFSFDISNHICLDINCSMH